MSTTHLDDATPVETVKRESGIEWCTHTIEVTDGCTHKSAGCDNCYAARMIEHRLSKGHPKRFGGLTTTTTKDGVPIFNGVVRLRPEGLVEILKAKPGSTVFVNSRSDLFHRDVSFEYIAAVLGCIAARPDATFIILTKRPERMDEFFEWTARERVSLGLRNNQCVFTEYATSRLGRTVSVKTYMDVALSAAGRGRAPEACPPNVWLGVSVENQATADERIPHLLKLPGRRMLSCEPLLGEIDLRRHIAGIHWVIVGGESGKDARPMHPDWARSLRDQCIETGTPFFFKQWGEFAPPDQWPDGVYGTLERSGAFDDFENGAPPDEPLRVGKRAAGRLLDGVEHSEVTK